MKQGLIKDVYELILKEIQTVMTVSYLVIIAVGMLFKQKAYAAFGINIFEYADIFDFLIAPFQDRLIILAALLGVALFMIIIGLDLYTKKRFPKSYTKLNLGWDKKRWYRKLRLVSFVALFLYIITETAQGYAQYMKRSVVEKEMIVIKYTDGEVITGKVIGKTKEMLFLLKDTHVKIIPITSVVKEIQIK